MIRLTARLYYIAKLSKAMKWLKIKLPLSCQICPVIDGRLTVECPIDQSDKGIVTVIVCGSMCCVRYAKAVGHICLCGFWVNNL